MQSSDPEGATPLDPDEADGLLPAHVTTRRELDELEEANIQHNRPQEVRCLRSAGRIQKPHRYALEILPERLPLQFLVPHVWPLKKRNEQTLGLHENRLWRADLGIHWQPNPT